MQTCNVDSFLNSPHVCSAQPSYGYAYFPVKVSEGSERSDVGTVLCKNGYDKNTERIGCFFYDSQCGEVFLTNDERSAEDIEDFLGPVSLRFENYAFQLCLFFRRVRSQSELFSCRKLEVRFLQPLKSMK